MVLPINLLTSIALFCCATIAAPLDGLTKRSDKVLSLDFEVKRTQGNDTLIPTNNKRTYPSPLVDKQQYYITYLEFGSDKQKIGVDIDTGSSDLWVPSNKVTTSVTQYGSFNPSTSTTAKNSGKAFEINYADRTSSDGYFYYDTVSFANGQAPLQNFQFAVVDQTSVTNAGILGIGLPTLESEINQIGEYPNFPVALKNAGYISKTAYSLYLDPDGNSGTLLFGGKDLAKFSGQLVTLPHTGDSNRFDVTVNSLNVNGQNIDVNVPATLDTGSTISYLPPDVVNQLTSALGGEANWLGISTVPCDTNAVVKFQFNGIDISVNAQDLLIQDSGVCVLGVYSNEFASGLNVLGDNFLRQVYVVYDIDASTVSIAPAVDSSNSQIVPI